MSESQTLPPAINPNVRAYVRDVAVRSGSSFLLGMRFLPRQRREAMYAIYAFCREVDDIADEPGATETKLKELADWRDEIDQLYAGRPTRPTTKALLDPIDRFDLQRKEFLAVIDGMEMDVRDQIQAPTLADFTLYCRRVAGAVGMLSIRAFGAIGPAAEELAVVQGEALQITNILRDLAEDAALGRLYLPRDLLDKHGITARAPAEVLAHPALASVCIDLAELAKKRFTEARELLKRCNRRRLRPAILMLEVYERILDRLVQRGWDKPDQRVGLTKFEKLWIVVRHGLL